MAGKAFPLLSRDNIVLRACFAVSFVFARRRLRGAHGLCIIVAIIMGVVSTEICNVAPQRNVRKGEEGEGGEDGVLWRICVIVSGVANVITSKQTGG